MDPLHADVDRLISPLDPAAVAAELSAAPLPAMHMARALTHVFGMSPPVALQVAFSARGDADTGAGAP